MRTLFLVCPTDNLELPVRKAFDGDIYFHTALGVHFEFEMNMQLELWQFIEEHNIDRVSFITSIQNVFYRRGPDHQEKQRNQSLGQVLDRLRETIFEAEVSAVSWFPYIQRIALKHLENEQRRLLSTEYLGSQLINANIDVNAYLFRPQKEIFHSLEEMNQQAHLLSYASLN